MTYNWHKHWENNDIAFHQHSVNPLLEKYWSQLNLPANSTVLVPLCGKTMDMVWLSNQGHHVVGIELSEIACKTFFDENNLSFNKKKKLNLFVITMTTSNYIAVIFLRYLLQ